MQVKVLFFGVLSDVTGTGNKTYSDVKTLGDLKCRIQDDFPEIVHYDYRISINNEFINSDVTLKSNDEVAFLPPFAGG
jgi:molybdopterin synthase sulfur carrier subunit